MKKCLGITLVIALITVITACGGSRTESGTTKDLIPVTLMMPRGVESLEDGPLYAALAMGYWEQEGLKVTIVDGGVDDFKMLETGQATIIAPAPGLMISGINNNMQAISFFQYDNINIFGFGVNKNSGIKDWPDFKGKTIALGDASWTTIFDPILVAVGLNPETDYKYVVAGESRAAMVDSGQIDILATWVSECYQYNGQGMNFNYIDGNLVLASCGNSFVTSLDTFKNRPEIPKGFGRGLAKGMYFCYSNPEASADINMKAFPALADVGWDVAVALAKGRVDMNFGLTPADTDMIKKQLGFHYEDKWNINMKSAIAVKAVNAPIPLNKIYTNELVDYMNDWDRAQVEADARNYKITLKP